MINKISIFLASDNNYAPFLATTIASISYNTNSFINFYILDGGISEFNKKRINSTNILKEKSKEIFIEYIKIDKEKYFKDFFPLGFPLDAYSRILIPLLKPDIDKAIYLDCDIIVLGDIDNLYKENLEDFILGAIPHKLNERIEYFIEKDGLNGSINHKYFNSGVLLINCKKFREENYLEKIFTIEKEYKNYFRMPDQDLLNKVFDSNYKLLSPKYNLVNSYINDYANLPTEQKKLFFDSNINNVVVRHFEGDSKPWKTDKNDLGRIELKNFEDFWFFAKMTNFFDGLQNKFIATIKVSEKNRKIILFNCITILTIVPKGNIKKYKLFGLLTVLKIKNN